jgi:hypothetical protein
MDDFDEIKFRDQVGKALVKVKLVLDNFRNPTVAADAPHSYDDKFGLAEFLVNSTIASNFQSLESLGLDKKGLQQLKEWAKTRSVTLRFQSTETCEFDREEKRKVESATQYETTYKNSDGRESKWTDKTVTTIIEFFWKLKISYELIAYEGNDPKKKVILLSHSGKVERMTSEKVTPHPATTVVPSIDVNITWLLKNISDSFQSSFSIDRTAKSCHTPRRNDQVAVAINFFEDFNNWADRMVAYFNTIYPKFPKNTRNLGLIKADSVFIPVQALFEANQRLGADPGSSGLVSVAANAQQKLPGPVLLAIGDTNAFLQEEKRTYAELKGEMETSFPDDGTFLTFKQVLIHIANSHIKDVTSHTVNSVNYIEDMLHKQVVAAIGKEVTAVDFVNYMKFHNRKLYKREFEPKPFSYAIRRPDHSPEGNISIESTTHDGSISEPIMTSVHEVNPAPVMRFPINAATKVAFGGARYLHAWMGHSFGGAEGQSLKLNARARQFSSFILLVGRINSATAFDPKGAIIIQNKDDLTIPLMLETIPTAKEFKDAIESLSPEQQDFAKAYRAMQLESSMFGLVVIQIKPQLEKLLKLPYDSLTKEIRLQQDLLELFMKYQIPSDMVTFGGADDASDVARLAEVKNHVQAMLAMVAEARSAQLLEVGMVRAYQEPPRKAVKEIERDTKIRKKGALPMKSESAAPMRKRNSTSGSAAPVRVAKPVSAPARTRTPAPAPAPSAPSAPSASSSTLSAPATKPEPKVASNVVASEDHELDMLEYTKIPATLDQQFESLDEEAAVRPTIINPGTSWTKTSQASLLAQPNMSILGPDQTKTENNRAYDLLDALTRSGSLLIDHAELHVILAATHCFDHSLIETIVQDNVNPIEKVERSSLIMTSVIHGVDPQSMIKAEHHARVKLASPQLFAITE